MSTRKRPSPRERVAGHLLALGYKLNTEDIKHIHGGSHKVYNDTIQCWMLFCLDANDNAVEIQSAYTLTECAKGIEVIPNTPGSDLYGDLLAVPKHKGVDSK